MKPNLVKIEGSLAARYVNGKFDQMVTVDYSAGITRVKEDIEYFRRGDGRYCGIMLTSLHCPFINFSKLFLFLIKG